MKEMMLHELDAVREFFLRAIRPLEEKDSGFTPAEGAYTVAAQAMHTALTVEWFHEGTFGSGFDMDFEGHDRAAKACTSLEAAKSRFITAIDAMKAAIAAKSEAELMECYPEGSIMQGPRAALAYAVADHTAHHRGALSLYVRLLGKQPQMPYMD